MTSDTEDVATAKDRNNQERSTKGVTRRESLRWIGLLTAGVGIASIGGVTLLGFLTTRTQKQGASNSPSITNNAPATSSTATGEVATTLSSSASSFVAIKVVYFGMPTQTDGIKQEYITLKSPAYLQDAISVVTDRHPLLLPMIGAMQLVIDGNPVEPDQQLINNDELDFIPVQAGG
jgi:hypothetical protein